MGNEREISNSIFVTLADCHYDDGSIKDEEWGLTKGKCEESRRSIGIAQTF